MFLFNISLILFKNHYVLIHTGLRISKKCSFVHHFRRPLRS